MPKGDYVITGGPGCGKTTLINALYDQGHTVVPEAARAVKIEQQGRKFSILPEVDNYAFQLLLVQKQLELEHAHPPNTGGLRFLDRTFVESYGYSEFFGNSLPAKVDEFIKNHRYEPTVFLLEPLPTYVQDAQRPESKEDALRLHDCVMRGYQKAGYTPVTIPAQGQTVTESLELRITRILDHVRIRA